MTSTYTPGDGDPIEIKDRVMNNQELHFLLCQVVNGLHRIEKQLEMITNEPVDSDDRSIL